MYLLVLNGEHEGSCIELSNGNVVLGRNEQAHIRFPQDRFISGLHAELVVDGGDAMIIRDLGSRNGTFVLGERVKGDSTVTFGDVFHIGKTFLKLTRRSHERVFPGGDHMETRTEAVVVVDIVGSSKIANIMGDRVASNLKSMLAGRLKKLLAQYPVEYVKSTGDGYMLIFTKAVPAVLLAKDLMKATTSDTTIYGLHLRIGINYGEMMVLADGDRRGSAVDMAFRVESLRTSDMHETVAGITKEGMPRINRIFITEAVHQFVGASSTVRTRCVGYFDIKGFTGRHKIFEVVT